MTTTRPESRAERMRREAHEACPTCLGKMFFITHSEDRQLRRHDCAWSGHAAIDAALDARAEEANLDGAIALCDAMEDRWGDGTITRWMRQWIAARREVRKGGGE